MQVTLNCNHACQSKHDIVNHMRAVAQIQTPLDISHKSVKLKNFHITNLSQLMNWK